MQIFLVDSNLSNQPRIPALCPPFERSVIANQYKRNKVICAPSIAPSASSAPIPRSSTVIHSPNPPRAGRPSQSFKSVNVAERLWMKLLNSMFLACRTLSVGRSIGGAAGGGRWLNEWIFKNHYKSTPFRSAATSNVALFVLKVPRPRAIWDTDENCAVSLVHSFELYLPKREIGVHLARYSC